MRREARYHDLFVSAALTVVLFLITPSLIRPGESLAAGASTILQVRAVVLQRISVNVLSQPSTLTVNEGDIVRGFVEVAAASLVEVRSNDPAGCLLSFSFHGLPFQEVSITGLERSIVLGPEGGLVKLLVRSRLVVTLGYRFILPPGTKPGVYDWPLNLAVSPV